MSTFAISAVIAAAGVVLAVCGVVIGGIFTRTIQ